MSHSKMTPVQAKQYESTLTEPVIKPGHDDYDLLVFIGRFQPFHLGHKRVVDAALKMSKRVLMLVGSANRSRSFHNPWLFEERKSMIRDVYSGLEDQSRRLHIEPLNDIMYNDDLWIEQVQRSVNEIVTDATRTLGFRDQGYKIGLIGCAKDHTSYYLKLFPTWFSENVEFLNPINATDIREDYFDEYLPVDPLAPEVHVDSTWRKFVPDEVEEFMDVFTETDTFEDMMDEFDFVFNYKESVRKYPRIEHTVDSVVVQSGHVLLIRRRSAPGKGMWALPGGFVNQTETLRDAAIRELREETKIDVPVPVLIGNIKRQHTFDDPKRSDRARIITQAYLIHLPAREKLPKVKGSDDADKARWVPLADLKAEELFEDHYFIIQKLLGE